MSFFFTLSKCLSFQVHKPTESSLGLDAKRHRRPDLKRAKLEEAKQPKQRDRSSSRGVGGLEGPKEANADRIELQGA